MMKPQTLQKAIIHFANAENCLAYMAAHRWPHGVECPTCGRKDVSYLANQKKWQCKSAHAKRQFTAKVGTIFEDSPLSLQTWLPAVWLISTAKNGVSSCEIARSLGVTQKTAWFMLHRIRKAMQSGSMMKLGGNGGGGVEADETFIGGKARNMHKNVHARRISGMGRNVQDKIIVMGLLERGGRVHTEVIPDRQKHTLQPIVREHVEAGSALFTDEMGGYKGLGNDYLHQIIDHAVEYVNGRVHTNGIENFWSLLKRGLSGTYVSVEPFHLFRYLDEQVFRYNNRATQKNPRTDADRFSAVLSQVAGKRLTYAEVTGKVGETIN
jgi:transposase-like protein